MNASVKTRWLEIWGFYQNIKKINGLTSYDILRQLDVCPSLQLRQCLSVSGNYLIPSIRRGTVSRKVWDILISGLKKEDWLPSTSDYYEKLEENICDGMYPGYIIYFLNYENCKPVIEVIIDNEKYYNYNNIPETPSINYLEKLFTIEQTIPKIKDVFHSYWL